MNKIHVMNIGYPKCGTTWLWDTLVQNQSITDFPIKENNSLITGCSVTEYCQQYTSDVSANFSTANMVLDQYVIEQLAHCERIYVSIILRSPIELLWSLYNFLKINDVDFCGFCYRQYDAKWQVFPSVIIERWQKYFGTRFKIFWYSDLQKDNLKFYINYCNTMGLDSTNAVMPDKINVTTYQQSIPKIDQDIESLLSIEDKKMNMYK